MQKEANIMKTASFSYILKTVQQNNILPVTSSCGSGCIFCSHRNNPDGIEAFTLPYLTFDQIALMCEFLNENKKIVIGESASRIIEGEPFIRKDMLDIIKYVRRKFPIAEMEITTGGSFLTYEVLSELKGCMPLEINISLNSSSKRGRDLLHKGMASLNAVDAVRHMRDLAVPFHGSIVAMPDVVGYGDIENTIAFLCENGAKTIRVFAPGFSSFASFKADILGVRDRLLDISESMYSLYNVPVLVEPPKITCLDPEVCGVIKQSPAASASASALAEGAPALVYGLEKGDVILSIDGYRPVTRVDAYEKLFKAQNPEVVFKRRGIKHRITIGKKANQPSGAVFYCDIHPQTILDIDRAVRKYKSKKPAVLTSELGYPIIKMGIEKLSETPSEIIAVKNRWFGGSIMCAGLLTVEDIISTASEYMKKASPDLILVPSAPFDAEGRDLSGKSFYDIEQALCVSVVVI